MVQLTFHPHFSGQIPLITGDTAPSLDLEAPLESASFLASASEPDEPWVGPWSPPQPEPTKRHYEWCYLQLKKMHLLMIVFG